MVDQVLGFASMDDQVHLLLIQGVLALLLVFAQAITTVLLVWVRRDNRQLNGRVDQLRETNDRLDKIERRLQQQDDV